MLHIFFFYIYFKIIMIDFEKICTFRKLYYTFSWLWAGCCYQSMQWRRWRADVTYKWVWVMVAASPTLPLLFQIPFSCVCLLSNKNDQRLYIYTRQSCVVMICSVLVVRHRNVHCINTYVTYSHLWSPHGLKYPEFKKKKS